MKVLIFLAIAFLISITSQAQQKCSDVFLNNSKSAYEIQSQRMTEKYPAFKDVVSDPQRYFKVIENRFETQKRIDPESPYDFDFSDWAKPLFHQMHRMLATKKSQLNQKLNQLKSSGIKEWWNKKKIEDVELGLVYFDEILWELEFHLKERKITYKDTFEISYFYSRAAGIFDISIFRLLNLRDRLTIKLDETSEGYKRLSVQEEFDRYKRRDVQIFDKETPIKTWQAAAKPFEDAIFNKEKLETIILPTTEFLGTDVFMHLLSSNIHLIGVGANPIAADGYYRPSGLFFLHDLRHASFMYYRTMLYKKANNLNRDQIDELSRFMAEQVEALEKELASINDKNLVGAINYYLFNQHHDGGYHFAPSNYLTNNAYHAPFILYVQMVIANQPREFKSITDIARARKWLETFWKKRVAEERRLIQSFQ